MLPKRSILGDAVAAAAPNGARFDSPGRLALGSIANRNVKPQRGEIPFSVPYIALVKFYLVPVQQRPKFILKRYSAMVFFLIGNVRLDLFDIRLTHRECAIAGLPIKISQSGALFFCPR